MDLRRTIGAWPVLRQLRGADPLGRGGPVAALGGRAQHTEEADRVVRSICPYCAVACGQPVFVKDERVTEIEATRVASLQLNQERSTNPKIDGE